MLDRGLDQFAGRRVLLLQGPVGPFFARFARALKGAGAEVHKVNFNAGDWLFHPQGAIAYRGRMKDWPAWVETLMRRKNIDVVFLFGDCRPIHQAAHTVATRLGIEIGVFEEGYLRPDYVTLERHGVNGYSRQPRNAEAYAAPTQQNSPREQVGNAFGLMARFGFLYFLLGALGKVFFPNYRHHRPLSLMETVPWVRSLWRKHWYRLKERGAQELLTTHFSQQFFLVPLQVFNDAQVTVHSRVSSIEGFISSTLQSFAAHAPAETKLVFKHHPMDRGYCDYTRVIRRLAAQAGVSHRVVYLHDQHLPSLLRHTRGVVVINSTVGLAGLQYGAPTLTCGNAFYDVPGLTYSGELDQFWTDAQQSRPDPHLYKSYRENLILRTQINGSFYKTLAHPEAIAGLLWGDRFPAKVAQPDTVETQANRGNPTPTGSAVVAMPGTQPVVTVPELMV
jgi:capsular polysaccharide export protein